MNKSFNLILLACCIAGCETMPEQQAASAGQSAAPQMNVIDIADAPEPQEAMPQPSQADRYELDNFGALKQAPEYTHSRNAYQNRPLHRHIGDYVQNMTQDLISNMEYLTDKTPVGVTHFALLDGDLQQTNLLGHQMAESFVHELHKFRIPVIDYKATQYIRVTEQGDFFLSRDFLELNSRVPIEYILTGTMVRHRGGFMINARILGLESKAVVASAQMLVPHYVVEAILPTEQSDSEETRDGVRLIQG